MIVRRHNAHGDIIEQIILNPEKEISLGTLFRYFNKTPTLHALEHRIKTAPDVHVRRESFEDSITGRRRWLLYVSEIPAILGELAHSRNRRPFSWATGEATAEGILVQAPKHGLDEVYSLLFPGREKGF